MRNCGQKWIAFGVVAVVAIYLLMAYWANQRERTLRREATAVRRVARALAIPSDGDLALEHQVGDVVEDGKVIACSMTGGKYIWSFPADVSVKVQLTAKSDTQLVFFAQSVDKTSDNQRVFIFPSPLYGQLLKDSQVDWRTHRLVENTNTKSP
jgi:hypothetical protein